MAHKKQIAITATTTFLQSIFCFATANASKGDRTGTEPLNGGPSTPKYHFAVTFASENPDFRE